MVKALPRDLAELEKQLKLPLQFLLSKLFEVSCARVT
jgi:hypothetical protein